MVISRERALRLIRRRRSDRDLARTPSMGPLVLQAAAAVIMAVGGAVGLYLLLAWLLGVAPHPRGPTPDQQKLLADLVKIALGLAAGVGAAFALVVGYRRARVDEASSHRDDRRLFSSRYQDAADLIGNDKAAVRLAGIYAMARLADDWAEQRQQCIDVLCAYLRLPYDPAATEPGEREVRLTVIRIVTAHLQPSATRPWKGHDLDFTGAVFDGGDFSGAVFAGGTVNFGSAAFSGSNVDFRGAAFAEGGGIVNFSGAVFSGHVDFRDAVFSDGAVAFGSAEFPSGTVDFSFAQFSSGDVYFSDAAFSGGAVGFSRAAFSGSNVNFSDAAFSGGTVDFSFARFSSSNVYFGGAVFSGGTVDFDRAVFNGGAVNFSARLSRGTVDLSSAEFSGSTIDFKPAEFSGSTVNFNRAVFSGGAVDLSETLLAPGLTAPGGLPEAPIAGLKLPDWLKQTSPGGLPPH